MLAVLAESALRSLALGLVVWGFLKVLRVRNPHIRALAWKAVLAAAFIMPALMQWTPMPVPIAGITFSVIDVSGGASPEPDGMNWELMLLLGYLAVTAHLLLKYLLNLGTGWALVERSRPLENFPSDGVRILISDKILTPATFASTILVPGDFAGWDEGKKTAVILHERTHIQNRDFYWQAAAQLHRILFWFSPLAWWLPRQLSALAEDLSDDAAIDGISDRVQYAGILLNITARHREIPAALAMAQPGTISQRIERILGDHRCWPRPNRLRRAGIWLALLPAALVAASGSPNDGQTTAVPDSPPTASAAGAPSTRSTHPDVPKSAPGIPSVGLTKPPYPAESRRNGEEGVITLLLLIREDGTVGEAQVERSSGFPKLDAAAAAHATTAWRFKPATENGVPVAVWHSFRVKFSLDNYPDEAATPGEKPATP